MQANTSQRSRNEKLNFWHKLAFGVGDIFGGGSGVIIGFYYLVFLTDVMRINPALAGTVFLISKAYDAVTDPFEGLIADRTRTRWGRRRPYLMAGIPLIFISFFLLWYPAGFESELWRFAYVVAAYLFFSTIMSIVSLSYNALVPELSTDYNERTSLSSFRIFFSSVASILSAVLPMEIVKQFSDVRSGYIFMALVFALLYALPFIATVAVVRERQEFQRPPVKFNLREGFIEPFKVRTFVSVLFMYLLAFVGMDVLQSIVVYFMKNYLGRSDTSFVSGTLLILQVASLPFFVWLSRKTSKRNSYMIGAGIWMLVMLTSLLITPQSPRFAIYLFAGAVGIGTGGVVITIYAIFPDVPDIGELSNGKRQEGTFSALTGFSRKLSSAFAAFLVGNLLGITGYRPPTQLVVEGGIRLVEQPQTDSFILALRLIFVVVPLIFLGAALLIAQRYPLDEKLHQRLQRVLVARRSGAVDEEIQREGEELERRLVNWHKQELK